MTPLDVEPLAVHADESMRGTELRAVRKGNVVEVYVAINTGDGIHGTFLEVPVEAWLAVCATKEKP